MEARVGLLLVILVTVAGCAGIDPGEALEDAEKPQPDPAANGTSEDADEPSANANGTADEANQSREEPPVLDDPKRETLQQSRVTLGQNGTGWTAILLNVTEDVWRTEEEWGDEGGSVSVTVVARIAPNGTTPIWGYGTNYEERGFPPRLAYSMLPDRITGGFVSISYTCNGDGCPDRPPLLELVQVLGVPNGTAQASLGITQDPDASWEQWREEGRNEVPNRTEVRLGTRTHGNHAAGGTYLSARVLPAELAQPTRLKVGEISVSEDQPIPSPNATHVATDHRMGFTWEAPQPGLTNVNLYGYHPVEATPWQAEWNLPPESGSHRSVTTNPQPAGAGDDAVVYGLLGTEAGAHRAFLNRTITGVDALTTDIGQWAFLSGDLPGSYGWEIEPFVQAGTLTAGLPQPGELSVDVRVCSPSACFPAPGPGAPGMLAG